MTKTHLTPMTVYMANPRGFCAGVDRAIQIVERGLEKFGAPVYVRHEIVHNKFVVDSLKTKGAIFIKELSDIPAHHHDRPVVFSAHGVPKSVPLEAQNRNLFYLDATCPLVSKVHREAERHHRNGRHIILIGHAGHPEVVGTMGQLPDGAITLIESVEDVARLTVHDADKLAYVTQTTLSIDDTKDIIEALQRRFPTIESPVKEDICYATTNRQDAVKELAAKASLILVLGAPNSSNSNRLVETAKAYGANAAYLIQHAGEIDWDWFNGVSSVGITAGASAPEILVQEVVDAIATRYRVTHETLTIRDEHITFKLPRALTA